MGSWNFFINLKCTFITINTINAIWHQKLQKKLTTSASVFFKELNTCWQRKIYSWISRSKFCSDIVKSWRWANSFDISIFAMFVVTMDVDAFPMFASSLTTLELLIVIVLALLLPIIHSQSWIGVNATSTFVPSSLFLSMSSDYGICCF